MERLATHPNDVVNSVDLTHTNVDAFLFDPNAVIPYDPTLFATLYRTLNRVAEDNNAPGGIDEDTHETLPFGSVFDDYAGLVSSCIESKIDLENNSDMAAVLSVVTRDYANQPPSEDPLVEADRQLLRAYLSGEHDTSFLRRASEVEDEWLANRTARIAKVAWLPKEGSWLRLLKEGKKIEESATAFGVGRVDQPSTMEDLYTVCRVTEGVELAHDVQERSSSILGQLLDSAHMVYSGLRTHAADDMQSDMAGEQQHLADVAAPRSAKFPDELLITIQSALVKAAALADEGALDLLTRFPKFIETYKTDDSVL